MTETSMRAVPGKRYHGVACEHCGITMRIHDALATIAGTFEAKCPGCGWDAEYRRGDIRALVARRKQDAGQAPLDGARDDTGRRS